MAEGSLSQGVAEDGADPALPAGMLTHTERFGCSLQFLGGHILHGQYPRESQVVMGTPSNATLPVLICAAVGGHRQSWKCK